jgi:hypothetical protein
MRQIVLPILLSLLLPACAAVDDSKKVITLDKATRYYERAIRWSDFNAANALRRQEKETGDAPDPETLKHIKVTSYERVNAVPADDDNATMRITVEIIYYHDESMKLVTLMDHQVWKYDTENKTWYITTPLPAFR